MAEPYCSLKIPELALWYTNSKPLLNPSPGDVGAVETAPHPIFFRFHYAIFFIKNWEWGGNVVDLLKGASKKKTTKRTIPPSSSTPKTPHKSPRVQGQDSPHTSPASPSTSHHFHQAQGGGGPGQSTLPSLSSDYSLTSTAPSQLSLGRLSNSMDSWGDMQGDLDGDGDDCELVSGEEVDEEVDDEADEQEIETSQGSDGPDIKLWMALFEHSTRVAQAYSHLC
jgi:hypothetical protein